MQVAAQAWKGRRDAEEHTGERGQADREREHHPVDADGLQSRQAGGTQLDQAIDRPHRDEQPERAANRR